MVPSHNEAWSEFVAIYEPLIYRLARAKGFQHADAQDLTQEVFTTVGGAIDRVDPDSDRVLAADSDDTLVRLLNPSNGPQ
ncbi:MAG TPA: sigma-70 family RNA polymerase sigma factor [Planctomycetes bacterium]|nr:sigma-70 family RNA polymerase sigma factor [Planctomycetaceae bacterium]HIK94729.1 sigma-70 family RNA polymerase sigma factor [Planctomycetota bacterium]